MPDWATAIDYGTAAKETAPTVYFRGFAFGFLAPALCHTGAVDEGLPILEQIIPMAKAARHELAWTFLSPRLADAYMTAGDYVRAHQLLLEIHSAAAKRETRYFLGASGRCLGEVALAQGDAEEAVRRLEPAIETLRASGSENELGLALGALARAKRLTGDDVEATVLPEYRVRGVLEVSPFASLDPGGVVRLMALAVETARGASPELVFGLCGEHGGDPASVAIALRLGIDHVSCSAYRVPVARLAAAHAVLEGAT